MFKQRTLMWLVIVLLILPLAVTACGGDDDDGGDNTAAGNDTGSGGVSEDDADDNGSEAAESGSAAGMYKLGNSIETGGLAVFYPEEGWVADTGPKAIHLATDADALGADEPPAGGAIIDITYSLEDTDASVIEQLDQYIAERDLPYGSAASLKLGDNPAAFANITSDTLQGSIYAIDFGDGVVFMAIKTPMNELQAYAAQAMMIATAITFDAAQFEE